MSHSSPRAHQDWRPSDDRLETLVEAALSADPYVESSDIVVTAVEGHLRLNGAVDSDDERERAGVVAEGVEGVLDVDNRITVAHPLVTPDESDEDIQRAILDRIATSYPSGSIDVRVENGLATLTGVVATPELKRGLTEIAFRAGALLVKNGVRVEPSDRRSPASAGHALR